MSEGTNGRERRARVGIVTADRGSISIESSRRRDARGGDANDGDDDANDGDDDDDECARETWTSGPRGWAARGGARALSLIHI